MVSTSSRAAAEPRHQPGAERGAAQLAQVRRRAQVIRVLPARARLRAHTLLTRLWKANVVRRSL